MKRGLCSLLMLCISGLVQAQTFELPYTEKVKLNSLKVYHDKQTNHLLVGVLHKNRYQLIQLDDSLKLKANENYQIKNLLETEPEYNTGRLIVPLMHEDELNSSGAMYQSYKGGELVTYFMNELSGNVQYARFDTRENRFSYNTLISLEKNEFPVWMHYADERFHLLTIKKNSSTVRYCEMQHTTVLKDEKHEIDLAAHYASGLLNAEKEKSFSEILPTIFMKGLPAYALMSSIDPGVFAQFDQLTGVNHFFYQDNTISFYNSNSQKRTFRFTLSLKDFSTRCAYLLPDENGLPKFEKTPVAKQGLTVAAFDAGHDIKAVNESGKYITVVKANKPHVYVLHFSKATGELVRVEYFSNDDFAQLDKEKIYPATWFFQEKGEREANPEKFAKVAGAKLGTMAMLNIDLADGNILTSMIVRDDRVKLTDIAGALAESVSLIIPVGTIGEAFLVGAGGSMITDAFDAASWAASLKGNQMHCRLFDASLNEVPFSQLPKIPEIQRELEIIATLPGSISKDSEKADFLNLGSAHVIAYYD